MTEFPAKALFPRSHADWIAVLGGALVYTDEQLHEANVIGQDLARRGKGVLTGATTGLPYAAALGAKLAGGAVIGISPAVSAEEHVATARRPLRAHDFVVFSGMGAAGRSPLIMRSAPGAIFIGGEMGTLLEFCAGWIEGENVLGILDGISGISGMLDAVLARVSTSWNSKVIRSADPLELTNRVCDAVDLLSCHNDEQRFHEPAECKRIRLLLEQDHRIREDRKL